MKKVWSLLAITLSFVSANGFAAYHCNTEWTTHESAESEPHCQIKITSDACADTAASFCEHVVRFAATEVECNTYCQPSDTLQGKLETLMIQAASANLRRSGSAQATILMVGMPMIPRRAVPGQQGRQITPEDCKMQ